VAARATWAGVVALVAARATWAGVVALVAAGARWAGVVAQVAAGATWAGVVAQARDGECCERAFEDERLCLGSRAGRERRWRGYGGADQSGAEPEPEWSRRRARSRARLEPARQAPAGPGAAA
jgi:hypothetical protein